MLHLCSYCRADGARPTGNPRWRPRRDYTPCAHRAFLDIIRSHRLWFAGDRSSAVTAELVRALCSFAGVRKRRKARKFLQGLSVDELNYIADFLGACVLESNHPFWETRGELAEDVARFESCRRGSAPERARSRRAANSLQDREHKMILLLEYLSRCGSQPPALARAANGGMS
jgi:hypothetical protein